MPSILEPGVVHENIRVCLKLGPHHRQSSRLVALLAIGNARQCIMRVCTLGRAIPAYLAVGAVPHPQVFQRVNEHIFKVELQPRQEKGKMQGENSKHSVTLVRTDKCNRLCDVIFHIVEFSHKSSSPADLTTA
jgi:hypothetical protein